MAPNELRKKLIKVERILNIYKKNNKLVYEIPIEISIDAIRALIPQKAEDPKYYDCYKLNEEQAKEVSKCLLEKHEINVTKFDYYLVTAGIYNW